MLEREFEYLTSRGASHFCAALCSCNPKEKWRVVAGRHTQPINECSPHLKTFFFSSALALFYLLCVYLRKGQFSFRSALLLAPLDDNDSTAWIIDTSSISPPLHKHGYRRLRNLIARCSENKEISGSLWRTTIGWMSLFKINPCFSI